MKPFIVCVGGSSAIGKSTLAKTIAEEIESRFGFARFNEPNQAHANVYRTSFAAPLRLGIEELKKAIDVEVSFWESCPTELTKERLRPVYQQLADAMKKQFGQDIFARNTAQKIAEFSRTIQHPVVVVDDLRYDVELTYMQKTGRVFSVEVRREDEKDLEKKHDSEWQMFGSNRFDLKLRVDKPQNLWHKVEKPLMQNLEDHFKSQGWVPYP